MADELDYDEPDCAPVAITNPATPPAQDPYSPESRAAYRLAQLAQVPKFAPMAAPNTCPVCGDGPNCDEVTRLCKPCYRAWALRWRP